MMHCSAGPLILEEVSRLLQDMPDAKGHDLLQDRFLLEAGHSIVNFALLSGSRQANRTMGA